MFLNEIVMMNFYMQLSMCGMINTPESDGINFKSSPMLIPEKKDNNKY